mgnify:CR=1 FL=1
MSDNQDLENTIIIELKDGPVHITLWPDVAPQHCARMKELARSGQYDNVCFHRVIDGFMAQTGDVANGDMEDGFNIGAAGTGGSSLPDLNAEFSKVPHARGSIGAARSASPNSAGPDTVLPGRKCLSAVTRRTRTPVLVTSITSKSVWTCGNTSTRNAPSASASILICMASPQHLIRLVCP